MQHRHARAGGNFTVFGQALGAHQKGAAHPVSQQQRDRRNGRLVDHCPTQHQPDGVVDRFGQHIQIGLVLGANWLDVVDHAGNPEQQADDKKHRADQVGQTQPDHAAGRIGGVHRHRRHLHVSCRPAGLVRMEGIEFAVQPFIDQVIGRSDEYRACKTQQDGPPGIFQRRIAQHIGQHQTGHDKNVLGHMVQPGHLQIVSPAGLVCRFRRVFRKRLGDAHR